MHIATLFTLLILIACGVIVWNNHVQGRKLVVAAAVDLIGRIHDEAGSEMKLLFAPVETLVALTSGTPITTVRAIEERLDLLPPFADVLKRQSQIAAMYVGYDNGEFLLVRAMQS